MPTRSLPTPPAPQKTPAAPSYEQWPLLDWAAETHLIELAGFAISFIGLFMAAFALVVAVRQLRPLRQTLEEIAREQKRARRLATTLVPPRQAIQVRGFDPRFDNKDWTRILQPHLKQRTTIRMKLSSRYREFYQRCTEERRFGSNEVVLVDLLLVPRLLRDGWIQPLTGLVSLQDLMEQRREVHGVALNKPILELATSLSSNLEGVLGALPVWINSHGRFLHDRLFHHPSERPITTEMSFHRLLNRSDADELFGRGSIQSSYLGFELYAHLAYRGCQPFTARMIPRGPSQTALGAEFICSLVIPDQWRAFAQAAADLATRLQFSAVTRDGFRRARTISDFDHEHALGIGHVREAELIRKGEADWTPVCSSELLRKLMPRRDDEVAAQLSDEGCFKPPFHSRDEKHRYAYLSAIGGYGLALPAAAASNPDALDALRFTFLANPCMHHPYLGDMIDDAHMSVQEFAERHSRPRVPFWSDVEKELDQLLFKLLLQLDRNPVADESPATFWTYALEMFTEAPAIDEARIFLDRLKSLIKTNEWTFVDAAALQSPPSGN